MQHPLTLPADATFEEYLALAAPEDEVDEVPVDPYSMDGPEDKPPIKMVRTPSSLLHHKLC